MNRLAVLAVIMAGIASVYLWLLLGAPAVDVPEERELGAVSTGEPNVHLYFEPVGIDAARDAMQLRISLVIPGSPTDVQPAMPDRDLAVIVVHDKEVERVDIRANQRAPTTQVELNLNGGSVASYPLDVYQSGLWVRCFAPASAIGTQPALLPIRLTMWEGVLGFRVRTTEQPDSVPGELQLSIDIRRSRAQIFFAIAAYGAMALLACGALTIGMLVFLRIRRPEATLFGALGAIVFALPAMRNALPGSPPFGVWPDVFVFLWAELIAVFALMLLVVTWARTGPRP